MLLSYSWRPKARRKFYTPPLVVPQARQRTEWARLEGHQMTLTALAQAGVISGRCDCEDCLAWAMHRRMKSA